jgi:small subunit ribosomal protein S4e
MLDKLSGVFAPKPSAGPHKTRECLPTIVFLRNRLKYALTYTEAKKICAQRLIKIDGKIRTDMTFPAGFMDVITIEKTNEFFRLIYDIKGRFAVHRISKEEAKVSFNWFASFFLSQINIQQLTQMFINLLLLLLLLKYKLCKVKKNLVGPKGVPMIVTHDGRTLRYPDPHIKVNDTVRLNIESNKIEDYIKFDSGNLVMITGGHNLGRVGVIQSRERHPGSFDIVHVKDAANNTFATRY